jgi:nucleotide-binding universal stress UspA family protein
VAPASPTWRRPVHHRAEEAGPVLFAYDGSDLAKAAIAEAGHQLPRRREALVLTVWRTFNVGFIPEPDAHFDAACGDDVRQAAEQTAARGAALADAAGFRAQALAVEGTPLWKAVIATAKEYDASLIVLGSHRHASVAGEVTARSRRPVLIIRDHGGGDEHAASQTPPLAGVDRSSRPDTPELDPRLPVPSYIGGHGPVPAVIVFATGQPSPAGSAGSSCGPAVCVATVNA